MTQATDKAQGADLTPRQMQALQAIAIRPMTQCQLGEEMFVLDREQANRAGGRLLRALCKKGLAHQVRAKWLPTAAGLAALPTTAPTGQP